MGWGTPTAACLVCLKVGFCWKMAAACAAQGADPGHRCRPAPRHQRHLVPRAPRTAGPNLYLHKGVRGGTRGRGLALRGGGATGHPLLGWQFTKKMGSFGSCHWLRGLLPRTLAPRDGLHQTNSRQAPCVLNLNFSKGRQGPGRGGAMHHCGWWAHARVLHHQKKRGNEGIFLRFCVVSSAVLRPPPPRPEGPGAPLTPTTPTRYAVCVAPPKCGTQAMRGWRRGPCAGGCHCQWRFPQRPGIGSPHSTQPLSFVHMSCMHSGPRGLCAQWGAPLSRSHTPAERGPPYPQYVLGRRFWARNVTIA